MFKTLFMYHCGNSCKI